MQRGGEDACDGAHDVAIGTWVRSVPDTSSGVQTLMIATTSQIAEMAKLKAPHDEGPRSGVCDRKPVSVRLRDSWASFLRFPLTAEQVERMSDGDRQELRAQNPLDVVIGPYVRAMRRGLPNSGMIMLRGNRDMLAVARVTSAANGPGSPCVVKPPT
jgi:hypothetical protein